VTADQSTYDADHPLGQIAAAHPHVDLHAWQNSCGIKLNMIQVEPENQGKGYASAALRDLIAYADTISVPIALTPGIPEGRKGLSHTALKRWYAGYGFVPNRGRHKDFQWAEAMIRPARSS
jgi:GNAT superfamily N-acetyltransferase